MSGRSAGPRSRVLQWSRPPPPPQSGPHTKNGEICSSGAPIVFPLFLGAWDRFASGFAPNACCAGATRRYGTGPGPRSRMSTPAVNIVAANVVQVRDRGILGHVGRSLANPSNRDICGAAPVSPISVARHREFQGRPRCGPEQGKNAPLAHTKQSSRCVRDRAAACATEVGAQFDRVRFKRAVAKILQHLCSQRCRLHRERDAARDQLHLGTIRLLS